MTSFFASSPVAPISALMAATVAAEAGHLPLEVLALRGLIVGLGAAGVIAGTTISAPDTPDVGR